MKPSTIAIIAVLVIAAVWLISQTPAYAAYSLPSGNSAAPR